MAALKMREKIVIQSFTYSSDSQGTVDETWVTHQNAWAEVKQLSGSENFVSGMDVYDDIKSFLIHYIEGQNVTPKMRIYYDSQYYYIISVEHRDKLKTLLVAVRNDDE